MFATRLGGKFKEFPGLAKYVAMLKVSPAQGCVHHQFCKFTGFMGHGK